MKAAESTAWNLSTRRGRSPKTAVAFSTLQHRVGFPPRPQRSLRA